MIFWLIIIACSIVAFGAVLAWEALSHHNESHERGEQIRVWILAASIIFTFFSGFMIFGHLLFSFLGWLVSIIFCV